VSLLLRFSLRRFIPAYFVHAKFIRAWANFPVESFGSPQYCDWLSNCLMQEDAASSV
jgi:hypothetical protein